MFINFKEENKNYTPSVIAFGKESKSNLFLITVFIHCMF